MTLTALNRWQASIIHVALSAAIAVSLVTLMLAVWYPGHYFAAMGGATLILLLIGVDVVIGPLITLIVFNPKKKSLRFDLAVIAALQFAALAYGCSVMFGARPVYTVFVVDRFEVIAASAVDEASREKAAPAFRSLPLTGPEVIAARQPDDPKRLAEIVLAATNGGADLANLPEFYVPYAQFRRDAGTKARPLSVLAKRQPQSAAAIRAFVAESGRAEEAIGYLPMKTRDQDMSMVVDTKSGDIVGILPVYPW
jgi:hypothetical protein